MSKEKDELSKDEDEFYPDDNSLVADIFKHLEKRIDLSACNTKEDVIRALINDPKVDMRAQNLIMSGFPQRIIQMGLVKGWKGESWRNYPEEIVMLRRYPKGTVINDVKVGGRFMKGGYIVISKETWLRKEKAKVTQVTL